METQEWRLKKNALRDGQTVDDASGDGDDTSLSKCKLKYTHVLKRGVTEVEYYGLKLASMTSYPPKVVANAFEIAETITKNRQVRISNTF